MYMYQHDTTLEPDYDSLTCTNFFYSTIVLVVKGESIEKDRNYIGVYKEYKRRIVQHLLCLE